MLNWGLFWVWFLVQTVPISISKNFNRNLQYSVVKLWNSGQAYMSEITVVVQLTSNVFQAQLSLHLITSVSGLSWFLSFGTKKKRRNSPNPPQKGRKNILSFSKLQHLYPFRWCDQKPGRWRGLYNHMHGLGYDQPPSNGVIVGMSL